MRQWLDLAMANVDVDWAGAADAQEKVLFSIQSSLGNIADHNWAFSFVHLACIRNTPFVELICVNDHNAHSKWCQALKQMDGLSVNNGGAPAVDNISVAEKSLLQKV